MRTVKLSVEFDFTAIVPDNLVIEARELAQSENAPKWMRAIHERFPNDEDFLHALLTSDARTLIQHNFAQTYVNRGIGIRIAPPTVTTRTPETLTQAGKEAILAEANPGGKPFSKPKAVLLGAPV